MEEIFSDPVRIYPNPANHQVFILSDRETGGPVSYRFFDQAGREVLRGETSAPTHAVNLNTLAPGLYFIQLNASDGMTTKKIVIE